MRIPSLQPRRRTRIEIIPLIDIMFFLLASFMMVSLQMQKVQSVRANLPTATQARPGPKPDLVNVQVDALGKVMVDRKSLSFVEFQGLLTNRLAANPELPVYITGHTDTKHAAMIFVLDTVRRAGVTKVAFAVHPEGEARTANP